MKAQIHITLHDGVHDPEAATTLKALHHLGFGGVTGLRKGRFFEIELGDVTPTEAQAQIEAMCQKLLANPVMEQVKITFLPA